MHSVQHILGGVSSALKSRGDNLISLQVGQDMAENLVPWTHVAAGEVVLVGIKAADTATLAVAEPGAAPTLPGRLVNLGTGLRSID